MSSEGEDPSKFQLPSSHGLGMEGSMILEEDNHSASDLITKLFVEQPQQHWVGLILFMDIFYLAHSRIFSTV